MNTIELKNILKNNKYTKPYFQNILAYDQINHIQLKKKKNYSYIINSSPASSEGVHWLCIFGNSYLCNIFDPLGLSITKYYKKLYTKLQTLTKKIVYRSVRIQSLTSDSCGHFCCIYLFLRGHKFTHSQILNSFFEKNNTQYNENLIYLFLNGLETKMRKTTY